MADPYVSEVKYLGGASLDFIEIAVDGGTDVSNITVTVYNPNGSVRSVNVLGTKVATIAGKDVYVIDAASSATFNGLNKSGGVSVDTAGTVHQFISFNDGPPVNATGGAASGTTSTQIGQAGAGESLETSDGGTSYVTQTTPNDGSIPCFARGTRLATSDGMKRVEELQSGDVLINQSGQPVPVQLILSTKVGPRRLAHAPKLHPICLSAGCLGVGLPMRDLCLSPQHRVLVTSPIVQRMFGASAALIAAKRLTTLPGIYQMTDVTQIEYFHVITENHEVLMSEGVPSESFLIGPQTQHILDADQLDELNALFPNLLEQHTPASLIPPTKQQKKLIQRHAKNNRPIIGV
jgi:hypothetical protein